MASEKIFVNSAWAKKVPAKSPQGTPLNAGVNAFVSVDAALNKYPDDLGGKQVILLNKSTTVNNTKGDTDINYEYLASQEIDKEFAKNATTAVSTVTAAGDLGLNYNAGAGAAEATLGGFLNVNLSTKAGEESDTYHTVLGGKNVVSHSYAANDVLIKEAATIKSVATGSLNVSNSKLAAARGAFATVDDTEGFNITEAVPAFAAVGKGEAEQIEYATGDDRLLQLAGYTNVSLKNGSVAQGAGIYGGNKTYGISTTVGYNKDAEVNRIDKIYTLTSSASGSLTADKSDLSDSVAVGYATATITESNFGTLDAYNTNETEKSAYAMSKAVKGNNTLVSTKTVETKNRKQASTGKATISKVENGGSVLGYNNVSIANSENILDVTARSFSTAESSNRTTGQTISNQNIVDTETTAATSTTNNLATGTLSVKESNVGGEVSGFSTVTADKSNFAQIRSFKESTTEKSNRTSINNDEIVNEATKHSSTKVAIGKATLKESSVEGAIMGFSSVTGTNLTAGSIIRGWSKTKDVLQEQKWNDVVGSRADKTSQKTIDTAAGSVTLSKDSQVGGNVEGYSSVVAKDTVFGGNIVGGKIYKSTSDNYAKTVKKDVVTEVYSFAKEDATSATGKVDLSKTAAAEGETEINGEIATFQTVSLKDVTGNGVMLNGENFKETDSYKNTLVDGELIARTRKATVAKSTSSTLTVTNSGEVVEDFSAASVTGFNKVTANYGTFGDIYRLSMGPSTYVTVEEIFPFDKEEFALTYAKNEKKTALKATEKRTFSASGSVTLTNASANVIDGYSSVTLKTAMDEAAITAFSVNGLTWSDSYSVTTEKDADGNYISSAYNFVTNETPSLSFTAVNVQLDDNEGVVKGFKSADLTMTTAAALTGGNSEVQKESFAATRKGDLYNGTEAFSETSKAVGTVKLDKGSKITGFTTTIDDEDVVQGIVGASKVVATGEVKDEGIIFITINGGLTDSFTRETSTKAQSWGSTDVTVYNSVLVDAQNKPNPKSYDVVLENDAFNYARADELTPPNYAKLTATKYTETTVDTQTAKATATLTLTQVTGDIEGYSTVTLVDSEIFDGDVRAGSKKEETKIAYDKGVANVVVKTAKNILGTFSAVDSNLTATEEGNLFDIKGFATVTLDNAKIDADFISGKSAVTRIGKGEGSTWGDALTDLEDEDNWKKDEKLEAAGVLKADDSIITGKIDSFKTVSFTGDNEIHGGIYGISGSKDSVTIEANSGLTLMDNAKIGHFNEEVKEEFQVIDSLAINGTLRLAVADVDSLELSVKNASGKGMIAIQSDAYEDVKAYVVDKFGSKFEIVNGGDEDAIKTIRTRAEEHADDTQAKATALASETKVNGWLSGTDENEMFKDSADWFTFSKEKGGWTANDYVVELIGSGDGNIQAELWSGSTQLDESDWMDTDVENPGFKLNTEFLAESGYSSVQLKLFVDDDVDPASYSVSVARAQAV